MSSALDCHMSHVLKLNYMFTSHRRSACLFTHHVITLLGYYTPSHRFSNKKSSYLGNDRRQGYSYHKTLKPGTHWRQSWIQHGRLCWKSTVLVWSHTHWRQSRPCRQQSRPHQTVEFKLLPNANLLPKPATKSTVSATVDFVASVYRA